MTSTIERLRALLLDDGWDVETRAEALRALAEIEAAWTVPIEDVEREAQRARRRYQDRGVSAGSSDETQRACWVEAVRPLVKEVARLRRRLAVLDNPVRQALDADDGATATRWAEWRVGRACSVHGVSPWDVMGTADREVEIAAMLPLVREMRQRIADAAETREGAAWGILRDIAAVVLPGQADPSVQSIVDAVRARQALTWQQATDIALALAPEGDVAEQARTVMRIAGARPAPLTEEEIADVCDVMQAVHGVGEDVTRAVLGVVSASRGEVPPQDRRTFERRAKAGLAAGAAAAMRARLDEMGVPPTPREDWTDAEGAAHAKLCSGEVRDGRCHCGAIKPKAKIASALAAGWCDLCPHREEPTCPDPQCARSQGQSTPSWTPTPGAPVRTADTLQEVGFEGGLWMYRRSGATGTISAIMAEDTALWLVRHDNGTKAIYYTAELRPEPAETRLGFERRAKATTSAGAAAGLRRVLDGMGVPRIAAPQPATDDAPDSVDPRSLSTHAEILAGDSRPTTATHEIRLDGETAIVAEQWTAGGEVVKRYEVQLPFSQLVHLALNTTVEERTQIDARADWRGVDDAPDSVDPRDLPPDSEEPTERLRVAVLVTDPGDRVLLVESAKPGRAWELPGGKMNTGEVPSVAAHREVREEAGLDVVLSLDEPIELPPTARHRGAMLFRARGEGVPTAGGDARRAAWWTAANVLDFDASGFLSDLASRDVLLAWAREQAGGQ